MHATLNMFGLNGRCRFGKYLKPLLLFDLQRECEEFKVCINAQVATTEKLLDEGWTMQNGTPWPGNNVQDHPRMIQG